MQYLDFTVPIDIDQLGYTSEELIGKPEREPIFAYWDKKKQAVIDFGIDCYSPFTKPHAAFLLSTEHETALIGGNSSSKTWTAMAKVTAIAIGKHPTISPLKKPPILGWVACEDFSLNRDGPLKALLTLGQNYIEGYGSQEKCIRYKNGSEVYLKSYESGWKKFQSAPIDIVSLDEEPPEEIYKECKMRTMRTSGYIQTSMTPLEGFTWMYEYLFEDEDSIVDTYIVSLFDNFTLKEDDITRTISKYTKQERAARVYGIFTQMAGLVYPSFRRGIHTIPPFRLDKDKYVIFRGIDPHITTPTAVVYLAVGKLGDHYVCGEQFLSGSIPEICDEIKKVTLGPRWGWSAMDSAARTDIKIFGRDIYSGFCQEGINCLLTPKGPGSVGKGISDIRDKFIINKMLGIPELRIFEDCKMTIKDVQTLTRETYRDESKQGKKDKVAEGKHHHHAALRYIYQLGPRYFEPMDASAGEMDPFDDVVGY